MFVPNWCSCLLIDDQRLHATGGMVDLPHLQAGITLCVVFSPGLLAKSIYQTLDMDKLLLYVGTSSLILQKFRRSITSLCIELLSPLFRLGFLSLSRSLALRRAAA